MYQENSERNSVHPIKFWRIKEEIRVLGVDDGPFIPRREGRALVVGVVFRGGFWLDGVMFTTVEVDGEDSTERISEMILKSKHLKQLRVIVLDGITFGGFNVVDIRELYELTGLPVIVVSRRMPDLEKIKLAIRRVKNWENKLKRMKNAGKIYKVETKRGKFVYMQISGISKEDAEEIVRSTSTRSLVPEALRVAHIIASGLRGVEVEEGNSGIIQHLR